MPAIVTDSAMVAHSAIASHAAIVAYGTGIIGFVASGLVLTAFGMKDMLNLRITAICSNIAFIGYALMLALPPVLILHVILLPLNGWRLMGLLKQRGLMTVDQNVSVRTIADPLADERLAIGGGV
jgi:hypothetical protein